MSRDTVRAIRTGVGAGFLFEGLTAHMRDELQMLIEALDLAKPGALPGYTPW